MAQYFILLFFVVLNFIYSFCTPVYDSEDVGTVSKFGKEIVVTGQRKYPYMVHIQTFYINAKREQRNGLCGGVIIGLNTVLTAGHCLYGKSKLRVNIHAGVVDLKWEKENGQKLHMKDYIVHANYVEKCDLGDRDCLQLNDIGIIWTWTQFKIAPNIQIAELNKVLEKPVGKTGYVLGWGLQENNKLPSMLQRGLVKVLSKDECDRFSSGTYYAYTQMCLVPAARKTRSCSGDSGGPFVIDGVVYGISTITIYKPCGTKAMNVYTYVAGFSSWIERNLKLGPPKERRNNSPKRGNAKSPTRS